MVFGFTVMGDVFYNKTSKMSEMYQNNTLALLAGAMMNPITPKFETKES